MDWADELAARVSGPQVVNDSKTPSGTVHVGSLRGPVILDVITRALRAQRPRDDAPVRRRRPRPDGRPGAPDARRHRARDGPAAGPRARTRPATATPRYARHFAQAVHRRLRRPRHPARSLLLDERHLPDRGDGSVHPARARPGRRSSARSTGASPTSSTRTTWHPLGVICPTLRQGRHDDRHRLGRRAGLLRVPRRPRRPGRAAAGRRAGSARSAATPSCPGTSSGPPSGRSSA